MRSIAIRALSDTPGGNLNLILTGLEASHQLCRRNHFHVATDRRFVGGKQLRLGIKLGVQPDRRLHVGVGSRPGGSISVILQP
jgi:hypothetical protein